MQDKELLSELEEKIKLNILVLDRLPDLFVGTIGNLFAQHPKYSAEVRGYDDSLRLLEEIGGNEHALVLYDADVTDYKKTVCSVSGSEISPRNFIQKVKEKNPRAKVVAFGSGRYNKNQASTDKPDGYLRKELIWGIVPFIERLLDDSKKCQHPLVQSIGKDDFEKSSWFNCEVCLTTTVIPKGILEGNYVMVPGTEQNQKPAYMLKSILPQR